MPTGVRNSVLHRHEHDSRGGQRGAAAARALLKRREQGSRVAKCSLDHCPSANA